MFRRRLADRDEGSICRSFDPADAAHGVTLERAIDVRKTPFVVLIDHRRRHALEVELEQEVWSWIVPVIAVSYLDHEIVTVRAVDESFAGEPIRQVLGLVFPSQPDIFGDEMERHCRWFLLTVPIDHDVDVPKTASVLHQTTEIFIDPAPTAAKG